MMLLPTALCDRDEDCHHLGVGMICVMSEQFSYCLCDWPELRDPENGLCLEVLITTNWYNTNLYSSPIPFELCVSCI